MDPQRLREIYRDTRTIAVVGASADPDKPAHEIPRYLRARGYRVIPVTPRAGPLFDEPTRPSLASLGEAPDVVDVFRPTGEAETVARDAIAAGARILWYQPGTDSPEGVKLARDAGLEVITGLCMGAAHGQLGLGPGPRELEAERER